MVVDIHYKWSINKSIVVIFLLNATNGRISLRLLGFLSKRVGFNQMIEYRYYFVYKYQANNNTESCAASIG